jgi:hypothetical protein
MSHAHLKSLPDWKPSLALRKVDETEFVNAATYWTLSYSVPSHGPTYELRVNHAWPADEFAFYQWDAGDAYEIVSQEEYAQRVAAVAEHEPQQCELHVAREIDALIANEAEEPRGEETCGNCRIASDQHALEVVAGQPVVVARDGQAAIRRRLIDHWTALCLLVDPEVNTSTRGWRTARLPQTERTT